MWRSRTQQMPTVCLCVLDALQPNLVPVACGLCGEPLAWAPWFPKPNQSAHAVHNFRAVYSHPATFVSLCFRA